MPIQHVVLASGAVVAVSVAVATMIAIYESPEFRRYTEDVRRRIAMVIDSVNESINPPSSHSTEPRFNRPEDAEGFFLSRRAAGAEPGVDADEESCRRQREELLYWNAVRLEKEKQRRDQSDAEKQDRPPRPSMAHRRGVSFDDFLRPDENGEKGSYVFNSGADVNINSNSNNNNNSHYADGVVGLRRRGEGARGFAAALSANPFADEHHMEHDELDEKIAHQLSPPSHEIMSDIYSATTPDRDERPTPTTGREPSEPTPTPLIDLAHASASAPEPSSPHELLAATTATLDRHLAEHESAAVPAAAQEDRHQAFASIQAWAHESGRNFYSPLPVTPLAPISEPELLRGEGALSEFSSEAGELTPTDTMSLAGSGEDVANDMHESRHTFDVLSESEGLETPSAWSEVGSEISESDAVPLHS